MCENFCPISPTSGTPSQSTMDDTNEPNFDEEYEKAKQNLTFFEGVAKQKQELGVVTRSFEDRKAEMKRLQAEGQDIAERLLAKEEKLSSLNEDHDKKQQQWLDRDIRMSNLIFKPILIARDVASLQKQIALAAENLQLLQ